MTPPRASTSSKARWVFVFKYESTSRHCRPPPNHTARAFFSGAMKDDNIRFGQQPNPVVDWEEAMYGYRFVSLVPWNFISLSSTTAGGVYSGTFNVTVDY